MIRPGQGYALLLTALAVGLWLARGQWAPVWPIVATVVATTLYVALTWQRRVHGALVPVRACVIIPVKDNVGTVAEVVRRSATHGMKVYVVDDGSTDGSGDACAGLATVLRHPVNRGKGQALLTGLRQAHADGYTHALCLDADGQHDPDDLPAFLAAVTREPEAIWAGARDLSTAPGRSQFGRSFSNFWIRAETGWRVADSQCGFRAYPIAPVLSLPLGGSRYDMEVEVLVRALWAGTPVRDLPCRVYYPPAEERVTSFRPFVDNTRISLMNTRLFFGRIFWPPRWIPRIRYGPQWTGRARGTAWGWTLILGALRWTGRWPAYAIVTGVAAWFTLFSTTPGIRAYAARVGSVRIFRLYLNFAQAMIDRFLYLTRGPEAFTYIEEDIEEVKGAWAQPGGAILLTAHMGNIEVAGTGAGTAERRARMRIVRFSAPGDHGVAMLESMPATFRPKFIHVNQEEGFAALTIVRELRAGAIVAIHGDRALDGRTTNVQVLGAPMAVPTGPYLLAALAGVPIYVVGAFKEGWTGYRVIAAPAFRPRFDRSVSRDAQLAEWAQRYADVLDAWIRRWPEQWYNFHDAWAPRESGDDA